MNVLVASVLLLFFVNLGLALVLHRRAAAVARRTAIRRPSDPASDPAPWEIEP